VLAALNGVLGDYLAQSGNRLAIEMRLRHGGHPSERERQALRLALPQATRKLVVLVRRSANHGDSGEAWKEPSGAVGAGLAESSSGYGPRATAEYHRNGPWQVTFPAIYEKR
jgi:hypothetical protein